MSSQCKLSLTSRLFSILLVILISLSLTGVVEAALFNYKLSGSLVTGGDVSQFEISPDGRYAVFLADARTNTVDELFSVPLSGGNRIRLSGTLPPESVVQGFLISPVSQSVVYWTATVDGLCTGIYAVPIAGGASVNVGESIPAYKMLTEIALTADNDYVVYRLAHHEELVNPFDMLWAAPLVGSGPIALTMDVCNLCGISYQVTPTGAEVVYLLTGWAIPDNLYQTNMEGVREELATNVVDFAITLDGDRVVYIGDTDWPTTELFSIPIDGGISTKLSGGLVSGGRVLDFKIAPNSQQVVYRADELEDEKVELFSAPIDGSAARVKLLDSINPNGDVVDYQITPNSQGVVYLADQALDERFDLGAVGINGGPIYWLNKDMVAGGDVIAFAITPNSLGVVFLADKLVDEAFELFAVSVFGTLLTRLNVDLPTGGDVLDFQIAPNSQGVLYRADQALNDVVNLYAVPSVGGVPPVRVNRVLVLGGDVQAFAVTPDSQGVLYLADQDADGVDELYATFERQLIYLPLAKK